MFRDVVFGITVCVIGVAFIIGGAMGASFVENSITCNQYQSVTGKQTQYKFPSGCYINTVDGWQLYDEYKMRAIASEGLKK